MNRVSSVLSKSAFLPRLFCHRFLASGGPTDARQNVLVVIVDFNGEQQLHVNGRYSELLGRSPDFPFPGNVKATADQQLPSSYPHSSPDMALSALKQRHHNLPGGSAAVPLQKIVDPPFVVADDRTGDARAAVHRKIWQENMSRDDTDGQSATTTTQCEWTVAGVDSIRMLWEELNAMFGKRYAAGAEVTVISLRAANVAQQLATTTMTEAATTTTKGSHTAEPAAADDDEDTQATEAARMARRAMLIPGYEFVKVANALCSALHAAGFWADFVDPRNGRPYRRRKARRRTDPSLGRQSLVLEWDAQNTFSGLHITAAESEDAPTCKIIERADWAAMDFCGQIFTECPPNSKEMQQILSIFAETTTTNNNKTNETGDKKDGGSGDGRINN